MADDSRLNLRNQQFVRSVVAGGAYLVLFLAFHALSIELESFPGIHQWYIPAGLSLAVMLAYGLTFSGVVLIAHFLGIVWLQSPDLPWTWAPAYAAAITAVYALTTSLLRRVLWSGRIQLRSRRVASQLLLGGSLTGIAVGMTGCLILMLAGSLPMEALLGAALNASVGTVTGILTTAPFMLLFVIPGLNRLLRQLAAGRGFSEQLRSADSGHLMRQALRLLAMDVAIIWCLLALPGEDQFLKLCVLLLPMIWVGLAAGLDGAAAGFFGLGLGFPLLLGVGDLQLADPNGVQILLSLASLNSMLVAAAVTEGELVEKANNYRDAVLSAVSLAAEHLLNGDDWKKGFGEVLRRLGHAGEVSRVYLLEARVPDDGEVRFEATPFEWTSSEIGTERHQDHMMNLVRSHHMEGHIECLTAGEPYVYEASQLDGKERAIAEALGLRSTVMVPIFVEGKLWGCLGLDRSYEDSEWEQPEIDALLAVAQSLGTLLARAKIEEQFRHLVGNIRAVFWVANLDGLSRTYVSHAYEQIWGCSRSSLRERPDSWLEVIHQEDLRRVEEALPGQVRGEYDLEYRIILPDRSIRWIHDRGSPVRNEAGEVTQIVGIAEDITRQKEVEDRIHGTTHLLSALIDSLRSGILVEDESRKVRWVNHSFCKMFNIPISKESLVGTDSRLLYAGARGLAERVEDIINRGAPFAGEELSHEATVFTRDYVPLKVAKHANYHLWQYQNITDQKQAEEQIKASLKEKEVLLQEIHHRVKNNLQVISSLLSLQSRRIEDEQAMQIFADSQNRVRAMALVHERLYQAKDLARIDFPGYAQVLTEHLFRSYGANANVKLRMEVDPVPLDVDMAIPCGLIINELVSNSLKYAFPEDRRGEIFIRFGQEPDGGLRLVIRDDGVGFQKKIDLKTTQSLGLKLVHSLTRQLGGEVGYRNDHGTEFDIRFSQSGEERQAVRFTA